MKKRISILAVMLLLFTLTACWQRTDNSPSVTESFESAESTADPSTGQNTKDSAVSETDNYSSKSTSLIENFFLPYVSGDKPLMWSDMSAALSEAGYTDLEDEGTFGVYDPDNPGYILGGILTNESGEVTVAILGYYDDDYNRGVEVEFSDNGTLYYINVSITSREETKSLDELKNYLFENLL